MFDYIVNLILKCGTKCIKYKTIYNSKGDVDEIL
jgi:hypothetical protein